MTIFKAFYAQHSVLANAFCAGPWSQMANKVIFDRTTYGGLQTGIKNEGAQWDVILQTLIPGQYAGLLAVLYFDEYARARTESIHAKRLEDTRANPRASWYASAQIPLQAKIDRLVLSLKCIQLRSWKEKISKGKWGEHRKFIVTDICGSSWPAHLPVIGRSRTNAGVGGMHTEPVALRQPFGGTPPSKESDEDTVVRSDRDAHTSKSTTEIRGNQWSWLGAGPEYRELVKEQSQRYLGAAPAIDVDGTEISAGTHTSEKDALPKAEVKTLVRMPNARFEHMKEALQSLAASGVISSLDMVPARRLGQREVRSGYPCWKFIDDESLQRKRGPAGGFRTIYDKPRDRRNAHWRVALVFKFEYEQRTQYLIEIECNNKRTFSSLLMMVDNSMDVESIIETTLNVIAEAKGSWLETAVRAEFTGEPIDVFAYTHSHNDDGSIRSDLLHGFLKRCATAKP